MTRVRPHTVPTSPPMAMTTTPSRTARPRRRRRFTRSGLLPGRVLTAAALAVVLAGCQNSPVGNVDRNDDEVTQGVDGYRVATVAEGLEHPWGLAFLPDGRMLVTERPGRLRLVDAGALSEPLGGVPEVWAQGQGGLLDVALHPDFGQNALVYLSFSRACPGGGATTAVVRGRLEGTGLSQVEEIFEANACTGAGVHFGSRLAFDADGYLYVTVGDRGQMNQAQDRSNHQGTINRLHDDGAIPADNPYVDEPDMEPSIWAWGIRSPQGLTFHPETGELLESEHGPRGGDELNHIEAGLNYGWPEITYGINYDGSTITDRTSAPGMEQPLHYWVPSIATSGLAIYSGDRFPGWRGSAFIGGLAGTTLARVELDGLEARSEERLLTDWGRRIRDVRDGPDGYLYILTDEAQGGIYRLEPGS